MQVVSVLSKKPEVLRLIDVDAQKCTRENILAALRAGQDACSSSFLAKVAKLQLLEEAVACELNQRGHHPLLSKSSSSPGAAGQSQQPDYKKVTHSRPAQLRSSRSGDMHIDPSAAKSKTNSALAGLSAKDTGNTFATDRAAFGSTVARTFDVADMGGATEPSESVEEHIKFHNLVSHRNGVALDSPAVLRAV